MVITIPRKEFLKDPATAIRKIVENTSDERLQELQELSRRYTVERDWLAHDSKMLENLLMEAYVVPCASFDNMTAT